MNEMHSDELKLSAVLLALAVAGTAVWSAGPPTPPAESPKPPDTVSAYASARALVKPSDDEWQWRHIPWMQSVSAAQKKAAAEGKPIMLSGAAQGSVIGCL